MTLTIRHLSLAAVVGTLAAVGLCALRISNSISFYEPLQMVTSGAEWESFYAIWKAMNGLEVYTDRLKAPFNAAVYNWLFYQSYGTFTKAVIHALALTDAWIPTVGRFFTLVGVCTGIAAAYATFRRLFDYRGETLVLCLAFAVFTFCGPLVGWWAFTQRSDVWAFALEALAVMGFLRCYPRARFRAVVLLAIGCYLAWSFKQINVFAVGGAGLMLLVRRDWPGAALLAAVMIAGWGLTIAFGGAGYYETLFFTDFTLVFRAETGLRNLANLAVKTGPTLFPFTVALVLLVAYADFRRRALAEDAFVLSLFATLICATLAVPAAFQSGAAENYFFSLSYFQALNAIAGLTVLLRMDRPSLSAMIKASVAGWIIITAALCAVFAGFAGETDVRAEHRRNMAIKACMSALPGPVYNNLGYMMLPWMVPQNRQHFVVSFNYEAERKAGKVFEDGGIGGLIERGYFKSLVLTVAPQPLESWDGGAMKRYRFRGDLCGVETVFLRDDVDATMPPR
jgi:hypothetical protein